MAGAGGELGFQAYVTRGVQLHSRLLGALRAGPYLVLEGLHLVLLSSAGNNNGHRNYFPANKRERREGEKFDDTGERALPIFQLINQPPRVARPPRASPRFQRLRGGVIRFRSEATVRADSSRTFNRVS